MKLSVKLLISFIAGVFLLSSVVLVIGWQISQQLSQKQLIEPQLITIKPGESLFTLLAELEQKKLISAGWQIKVLTKLNPDLAHIQAGTFMLQGEMSSLDVIYHLTQGHPHQFKLTFVEGTNFKQWQAALKQESWLTQTDYSAELAELIQPYQTAEGLLFPDTYYFTANSSAFSLIKAAFDRMQQTRAELAPQLSEQDWYQTLILASIIEKETAIESEMPLVASVFVNRLNQNMRLQTDPTVIYGLGERYQGDIKRSHLQEKTPYNTYQIKGLPPTPIAMPGIAAIKAALNPATSDYLYFVADGKGGHVFTTNLKSHNKAVQNYLKQIRNR
ncbi:endolytic transglycosylase MltG [Catenovulum sp. 2E275]|uniref:endolytic transglycosylase MltG n=1 Tax=Catenovulum sp. 2E275 TaxID=2980497 RepID=UPI0021CEB6FA|nr:endolytic transglycosylase MltG [Catenovulum sp. 2E275]MCU4674774.1 endolytic transglycosylase MltG [Catenovulum sp. 2E275]